MKRLFLFVGFFLVWLCAGAQEPVFSTDAVTVYPGDTVKIVNFETLLERELVKDEREMKGFFITSSLDNPETKHYRLSSMFATTEFEALEINNRGLGNKYFTIRNIVTGEVYGIQVFKNVKLHQYVVNLSQQRREAKERYDHNLAEERNVRGASSCRINVRPYDIDSDIAVWDDKRIVMISGIEYHFADIMGCKVDSMEVYRQAKFDHDKTAKMLRKKQTLGELLAGEVGVVAATVAVAAKSLGDVASNTELVHEYVVTISTRMTSRPVIEINVGEDREKASQIEALIASVVGSNKSMNLQELQAAAGEPETAL